MRRETMMIIRSYSSRSFTSRWIRNLFAASIVPRAPKREGSLDGVVRFSSVTANGNDKTVQNQQQQHQVPPRRRSRRQTLPSSKEDAVPSLADFIHRAKVLKQYRSFIRLAHYVDGKDSNTGSGKTNEDGNKERGCRAALDEVRISYKMGMTIGVDAMAKNMSYVEGERRLRELETTVGFNPPRQHPSKESRYDADSWINIQDEDDPRGRVGVQWPWDQDKDLNKGK